MNVRRALLIIVLQSFAVISRADMLDQQLQDIVNQSTLIFTGTILDFGSNVPSIDSTDNPIIVRVDHVEWATADAWKNFGSLVGKLLTVIVNPSFTAGPAQKQNMSAVFFVEPLLYEKNIAVTANAFADDHTVQDLPKRLAAAVQQKQNQPLIDAVKSADRIVTGVVQDTRALPDTKLAELRSVANGRDLFSEHSPRWREAIIRVQSVLKGDPREKTVIVVFPSTDDRLWAQSPKFTVRRAGIWLLHGEIQLTEEQSRILLTPERLHGQTINAYTALRPEDFQRKDPGGKNEALIRQILSARSP